MSALTTRKATVIYDARRTPTIIFELDIPREGEVSLKHPDLFGLIESFIRNAYTEIPKLEFEHFQRPILKLWTVQASEYANQVLEMIQRRPRDTEEVRYTISVSGLEVSHTLQYLRSDDDTTAGIVYVPGFTTRGFAKGPLRGLVGVPTSTQAISGETCTLTLNMDMSVEDNHGVMAMMGYHAQNSHSVLLSFLEHSHFVHDAMETALLNSVRAAKEKAGIENQDVDIGDIMPFNITVEQLYEAVTAAAKDIFEERKAEATSHHRSIVLTTIRFDSLITEEFKPVLVVIVKVRRTISKSKMDPPQNWYGKVYLQLPPPKPVEPSPEVEPASISVTLAPEDPNPQAAIEQMASEGTASDTSSESGGLPADGAESIPMETPANEGHPDQS